MHPIAPYFGAPPMAMGMGYRPSPPASAIPGIVRPPVGGGLGGGRPSFGMGGGPQLPPVPGNDFPPTPAAMQQMYPFKPPTFDSFLCESFFPRCETEAEDTALTQVFIFTNYMN